MVFSGGIVEQGLTGLHAREANRLHGNRDLPIDLAQAGETRLLERPGVREVGAEVRAARLVARLRRDDDRAAHRDQAAEVEPVVPGEVESPLRIAKGS